jgi:hypothetical protein
VFTGLSDTKDRWKREDENLKLIAHIVHINSGNTFTLDLANTSSLPVLVNQIQHIVGQSIPSYIIRMK